MNRVLQWKLIGGFILVFIAGGITGAFFGGLHARHVFFEFHHPELIGTRMKEELHKELNLTPEQIAKISPIVDKTAAQLKQIRRDTGLMLMGCASPLRSRHQLRSGGSQAFSVDRPFRLIDL